MLAEDGVKKENEVLVTTTATLEEVQRDAELWKPSTQAEIKAILDMGAIAIVDISDVAEASSILPGKGVFAKKPDEGNAAGNEGGFRRKTRAVVCGNFEQDLKMEVYASGCDGIALRVLLRLAALRSWSIIAVRV